jgi:NAD kinase
MASGVLQPNAQSDVEWADLVVSVGGDGTFIRASHSVQEQSRTALLGVNSSPSSSFGFYSAGLLSLSLTHSLTQTQALHSLIGACNCVWVVRCSNGRDV